MIELLIVMSIIAILAMIAVPRFGRMIRTANENATRTKLGSLRTALSIYQGDTEGQYPAELSPLLQPGSKYLTQALPVYTSVHGNINSISYEASVDLAADTGAWGYVNSGAQLGTIYVQCTHTDVKGKSWNQY